MFVSIIGLSSVLNFTATLQISEVVNSMKDLIDYSRETGAGPMGKLIISHYLALDSR